MGDKMFLIVLWVAGLIGAYCTSDTVFLIFESMRMSSWSSCDAIIEKSEIVETTGKNGRQNTHSVLYQLELEYKYVVDGISYRGKRFHPMINLSSYSCEQIRHLVEMNNLSKGKVINVYYNSNSPEEVTIKTGFPGWFSSRMESFYGGVLFLLFFAGGMSFYWHTRRSSLKKAFHAATGKKSNLRDQP